MQTVTAIDRARKHAKFTSAKQALQAASPEERRLIVAQYAKMTFPGWTIGATFENQGDIPPRSLIGKVTRVRFKGNCLSLETDIECPPTKKGRPGTKLIAKTVINRLLVAFVSGNKISEVVEADVPFLAKIHLAAPKQKPVLH